MHLVGSHALGDRKDIFTVLWEPDFRLEEKLVVFQSPLPVPGPIAELVAQDKAQRVLLAMTVRIFCFHEDVEILCLKIRGVAHLNVHIIILHGILDGHLVIQRLVHRPLLMRQLFHFGVIGFGITAAKQKNKSTDNEIYAFHKGLRIGNVFEFLSTDVVVLFHLLLVDDGKTLQILRHLTLFVHLDNLFHALQGDRENRGGIIFVGIPDNLLENIDFIVNSFASLCLIKL